MPTVTFNPDGRSVEVTDGENLLRAALLADIVVHASCGGNGTCGKCLMVVEKGTVDVAALPQAQRRTGGERLRGRLQDHRFTAMSPCAFPRSRARAGRPRAGRPAGRSTRCCRRQERVARLPRHTSPPPVAKRLVRMMPPDGTDNVNDAKRVRIGLRRGHGIKDATISLPALRELPRRGRDRETGWSPRSPPSPATPCRASRDSRPATRPSASTRSRSTSAPRPSRWRSST